MERLPIRLNFQSGAAAPSVAGNAENAALSEHPSPAAAWCKRTRLCGTLHLSPEDASCDSCASRHHSGGMRFPSLIRWFWQLASGPRMPGGWSRDFIASSAFLRTPEWRRLRHDALRNSDGRRKLCGWEKHDWVRLHVDHLKPRRTHPHLALDVKNLEVLDDACNEGKGIL